MSTRPRPLSLPTPGMPPRFERLRFFSAPAEGGTPAPAPADPATSPTPEPPAQETDWKAKYEETLAHSRKWEERAKENKSAAEKLAELERANETEVERIKREAEEAKAERDALKAEKQIAEWKAEVEKTSGVPAAALAGSTLEEIQAHAETLKPLIAKPADPPKDDGKPHIPYRELSKPQAEAPAPTTASGRLRAAYANAETKK